MVPHPQAPRQHAFTLIEVMLAATVMLVGIVGMMHVVTSGAEMLDAARRQTIATQIMHGEIEKLRVTDWAKVTAGMPPYPSQQTQHGYAAKSAARVVLWTESTEGDSSDVFKFSRTVAYTSADQTQVAVSYNVNWNGNSGRAYSRSTSTYVGKNGLYVAYQR